MYSRLELRILAEAYMAATHTSAAALGARVADNNKFIKGLLAGRDITATNAERASLWFQTNWPGGVPWPSEVYRPVAPASRRHATTLR